MRLFVAILIGKIIAALSRTLKIGGGSAAPGLLALKVYPELVEVLSKKIPKNAVITGTNGKTTTARILAHLAKEAGLKVIRNSTGSNLERGIASALITSSSLRFNLEGCRLNFDLGIWELDEFAFNEVVPKIKPDIVVFLNVFRDQLDRYGEVDSVVRRWCETLKKLPVSTIILVNADDANTARLKNCFKGKAEIFGVEDFKIAGEALETDKSTRKLDFEASKIELRGLNSSSFQLSKFLDRKKMITFSVKLPIPGIYHIYDALAAIASASCLNLTVHRLVSSLKHFQPAFGRVEKLPFGYIFLIKNPAGATQVFETVVPLIHSQDRLLIALNDNLADGTDVSWIWDASFEKFSIFNFQFSIVCSGTRAHDMAVRLKYAGFDPKSIHIEPNLEKALKATRVGLKGSLFIFPTYTAMIEIQKILAKQGIKPHYWQTE